MISNRALVYERMGDYDHAIADDTEAIRLMPDMAGAYLGRGKFHDDRGELERAIADYRIAAKRWPSASFTELRDQALARASELEQQLAASAIRRQNDQLAQEKEKPQQAASSDATPVQLPTAVAAAPPTSSTAIVSTGRRVALVVANGAYRDASLANPKVDADLVVASLAKIGFAVSEKKISASTRSSRRSPTSPSRAKAPTSRCSTSPAMASRSPRAVGRRTC